MAALQLQHRLLEHDRLIGGVQHIPFDHRHRPLQASELTLMRRRPSLHAHHAIEQPPTGQAQQREDRHGDDQFQQSETALLIHHDEVSSHWRGIRFARARKG
ncbi:hypothetical protein D3C76_1533100 [compost metagenome]